ncbi:hypothetical protein K438DRAFT_1972507 [Mycena galopus ATCC 62051]|nr:hypothetical protein K438DRAFT_1972507 [Mycena galopus ATCC 62051]
MSSADFALNNEDPDNVASGRGLRHRRPTDSIEQHYAYQAKLATSLERRRANQVETVTSTLPPTTTQPPVVPHISAPPQVQDTSSHGQSAVPLESPPHAQNYRNSAHANNQPQTTVYTLNYSNPTHANNYPQANLPQTYPGFSGLAPYSTALSQNSMYTMPGFAGYPDFNDNDNDEEYDSHWSRLPANGATSTTEGADTLASSLASNVSETATPASPRECIK